jgi:hypothetical protein
MEKNEAIGGGEIRPLSPTRAIRVLRDSVAHALLDQERTRSMDMGVLIDGLLFGRPPKVVVVPFDDFRTKAAKEARDAALAAGAIVLKQGQDDVVGAAVAQLAPKIARLGMVEHHVKMEWAAGGCPHRGEMDGIAPSGDRIRIYDLKTCGGGEARKNASPGSIVSMGYDIQGMAYVEGLAETRRLDPREIDFTLVFVETEPPFAMVLRTFSPTMRVMGTRRWERARAKWLAAYATNDFSPDDAERDVDPPEWAIREEEEIAFRNRGMEPF